MLNAHSHMSYPRTLQPHPSQPDLMVSQNPQEQVRVLSAGEAERA